MLNQAAHPLAGASMTGADMLVQVLADEGVDTIFGYSGGAILPIYDAVFRYNQEHQSAMPLIVPANEQGAGFMAAGYARASGRVGVALVTSGPGATNTVTPVRDSMADSVPIVVICGQVPTTAIGTDAFQEAPVPSIMGAVAKHVFLVTGGGAMHLNASLASEKRLTPVCNLHEQASAIAAENYSKATNNLGVCMVTTGPGSTNTVTGVAGVRRATLRR